MNNLHYSSNSDEWSTPQFIFDRYNTIYQFEYDVCANELNTKCKNFYSVNENGLLKNWIGNCWCNPPYSDVKNWIKKAYFESVENNVRTVMLIPARTDTIAWHTYIFNKANVQIEFLRGRLKFSNSKNSAPFPSAIIIFNGETK